MQFDKAVTKDGAATTGVVCSMCNHKIVDRYWTLGDQPTCVSCKATVQREMASAKGASAFMRSSLFGFGASLAGAVLYYAVVKLTGYQLALAAIAIGYMVGRAMRTGARGWGGRRFQIAAAGLTYLSVGLAYMPLAFENAKDAKKAILAAADSTAVTQQGAVADDSAAAVTQDSTAAADPAAADSTAVVAEDNSAAVDSAATPVTSKASVAGTPSPGIGTFLLGVVAAFAFSLVLPIIIILGSGPGGLISVLIIGFGMRQAWRMTAGTDVTFQGPLTVAKG
jgi:hypothetical protein